MTKHRILLEFSADTLPDDFLDQIAGRVYGHPAVDKKECTAAFVGDVIGALKLTMELTDRASSISVREAVNAAKSAAKDTK